MFRSTSFLEFLHGTVSGSLRLTHIVRFFQWEASMRWQRWPAVLIRSERLHSALLAATWRWGEVNTDLADFSYCAVAILKPAADFILLRCLKETRSSSPRLHAYLLPFYRSVTFPMAHISEYHYYTMTSLEEFPFFNLPYDLQLEVLKKVCALSNNRSHFCWLYLLHCLWLGIGSSILLVSSSSSSSTLSALGGPWDRTKVKCGIHFLQKVDESMNQLEHIKTFFNVENRSLLCSCAIQVRRCTSSFSKTSAILGSKR